MKLTLTLLTALLLAPLAAAKKTTPLNVPLSELKDLLRKHGAIVPAS